MDCEEFHSDFCPICGGLIELETINETIHCQICGGELSFREFAGTLLLI
jgi:rRNA maturation endonuclease Nob1